MKKYTVLTLIVVTLFTSGCTKKESLNCTYKNDSEGNVYTTNVDIKIEDDIVVDATAIITYESQSIAATMCRIYGQTSNKDSVSCNDKVITLKDFHKSISNDNYDNLSKEDIIKNFENQGYTCK